MRACLGGAEGRRLPGRAGGAAPAREGGRGAGEVGRRQPRVRGAPSVREKQAGEEGIRFGPRVEESFYIHPLCCKYMKAILL